MTSDTEIPSQEEKTSNASMSKGRHPVSLMVRAVSHVTHKILVLLRVLYYNLTCFIFYKPLPLSTTIYGRLQFLHRPCRVKMGPKGRLGSGTYFATSLRSQIDIGANVTINLGCVFVAMEGISIGENTAIAEYVSIRDQEHRHSAETGVRGQGYKIAPITIGKNVWIGRSVYIGPGSVIGDGCIVAANSVVRGEFPPNVLIAGAPAVIKKQLA